MHKAKDTANIKSILNQDFPVLSLDSNAIMNIILTV